MSLKKYSISLVILSAYSMLLFAQDAATQEEPTRIVHITKCKKIKFGLTIDQVEASPEERENALNLISNFCNTELNTLSEQLAVKAPHVVISLVLVNIEEDNDDIIENTETRETSDL
jgi:hypothetical protein